MGFGVSVLNGRRVALRGLREPVCNGLRSWVRQNLEMAGGEVDYENEELVLGIQTIDGIDYRAYIFVPISVSGPDIGKRDQRFPEVNFSGTMGSGPYPVEYYGGMLVQMLCDYIGEHLPK